MELGDIRLRALEPEDLGVLYDWENDNRQWLVSNTLTPFSKFTLKRYIENSHRSVYETGQIRLMIDFIPDNKTIGTIDIFDFDPFHQRAGIGILIADEGYRRKGLATLAVKCLIDYCFSTLKLHQIYCNILESNKPSIDMFVKLGFREAGVKKEWIRSDKGFSNEHLFQLINGN
jgi:diamine N-acetyltransferase